MEPKMQTDASRANIKTSSLDAGRPFLSILRGFEDPKNDAKSVKTDSGRGFQCTPYSDHFFDRFLKEKYNQN